MGANTVVRYILQTPGIMGTADQDGVFRNGPTSFENNDKIYVFSKVYDVFGVADDHILFLPILNTHLFTNKNRKRNKTCYLVGKGTNQLKHPKNSIEITRGFASDQQALAELLNECQTLYCYDRLSAMMEVARLCGCSVRYYGELAKETLELYEPGMNGVTYKDDNEIQLDSEAFREHYLSMIKLFDAKLNLFIESTQVWTFTLSLPILPKPVPLG